MVRADCHSFSVLLHMQRPALLALLESKVTPVPSSSVYELALPELLEVQRLPFRVLTVSKRAATVAEVVPLPE